MSQQAGVTGPAGAGPPPGPAPAPWTPARLLIGALVVALVAGIAGGLIGAFVRSDNDVLPAASGGGSNGGTCDVVTIAQRSGASVVTITALARGGKSGGTGTGSLMDSSGHILTNNHVVEPAANGGTLSVAFGRSSSELPATLVARDPLTDVAVIQIQSLPKGAAPIAFGDSAVLLDGQPVVAVGAPLGLSDTVTSGIVSALDRYVSVGSGAQPSVLVDAVQTDAAINPGNSGGPLEDCSGRQVGINSAIATLPSATASGSIGLGFAIPIDFARSIADQLIATGQATHQTIGIEGVTVTPVIANATGLPEGAYVAAVVRGFGADMAGIQVGDVITSVAGISTPDTSALIAAVRTTKAGDVVTVAYTRAGASQSAKVAVSEAG